MALYEDGYCAWMITGYQMIHIWQPLKTTFHLCPDYNECSLLHCPCEIACHVMWGHLGIHRSVSHQDDAHALLYVRPNLTALSNFHLSVVGK